MNDFWKGFMTALGLQWLFGNNNNGCGCGGCLTFIILAICFVLYCFNLFPGE